ncbi:MAG: deoxynucleoside kinase [Bacteroidia bacterium]|nr:deoxynucleoside kinase [Bacteroidia bacterium]MCZ2249377.1 deoxynucleoside kinase [Bacteroidia bacterium]
MLYNFIAIEGNIGAGKTTLSTMLAKYFNAKLILEQFSDNPFLPDFYKTPDKFAFPLELSFLADRYTQLKNELINLDLFNNISIADYFIYKSLIFAGNNLKEDELFLYQRLFEIIASSLPKPDLLIYLYRNTEQLQHNILKRGREYEKEIKPEYLEKIQQGYLSFIQAMPQLKVLVIDLQQIDFVHNHQTFMQIVNLLEKPYPSGVNHISLTK